jgi:hypothetical protein
MLGSEPVGLTGFLEGALSAVTPSSGERSKALRDGVQDSRLDTLPQLVVAGLIEGDEEGELVIEPLFVDLLVDVDEEIRL